MLPFFPHIGCKKSFVVDSLEAGRVSYFHGIFCTVPGLLQPSVLVLGAWNTGNNLVVLLTACLSVNRKGSYLKVSNNK